MRGLFPAFLIALFPVVASAQQAAQPAASQAEQTLMTALQGQTSSNDLVRSALQAYAAEKEAKIKTLEAELASLKPKPAAPENK
jgi:hypothetical protein